MSSWKKNFIFFVRDLLSLLISLNKSEECNRMWYGKKYINCKYTKIFRHCGDKSMKCECNSKKDWRVGIKREKECACLKRKKMIVRRRKNGCFMLVMARNLSLDRQFKRIYIFSKGYTCQTFVWTVKYLKNSSKSISFAFTFSWVT